MNIGYSAVDNKVWEIQKHLMNKYGYSVAEREIDPLKWWINTGRASVPFLNALMEAKSYMIARKLHQGGSYEEMVSRVMDYLGIERG